MNTHIYIYICMCVCVCVNMKFLVDDSENDSHDVVLVTVFKLFISMYALPKILSNLTP